MRTAYRFDLYSITFFFFNPPHPHFHCFSLMQILIHLLFILLFFFLSSALREHRQLNIPFEIAQLQTKGIFFSPPSAHLLARETGLNTWK